MIDLNSPFYRNFRTDNEEYAELARFVLEVNDALTESDWGPYNRAGHEPVFRKAFEQFMFEIGNFGTISVDNWFESPVRKPWATAIKEAYKRYNEAEDADTEMTPEAQETAKRLAEVEKRLADLMAAAEKPAEEPKPAAPEEVKPEEETPEEEAKDEEGDK